MLNKIKENYLKMFPPLFFPIIFKKMVANSFPLVANWKVLEIFSPRKHYISLKPTLFYVLTMDCRYQENCEEQQQL